MDSACMAQYSCSSNMHSAMEDDGKDAQKLAFTLAALRRSDDDDDDPFLSSVVVPADVVAAIEWQSVRSATEIIRDREKIISEIEACGAQFWKVAYCVHCSCHCLLCLCCISCEQDGSVAKWFEGCDPVIAKVSATVNGPLMEKLASAASHKDIGCIEFFRKGDIVSAVVLIKCVVCICACPGAALMGVLDMAGIGEPIEYQAPLPVDELKGDCLENNCALLQMLTADDLGAELVKLTEEDVRLGRMTRLYKGSDLTHLRLHRRFGVEQGTCPNGKVKVRSVDHFSWSATKARSRKKRKLESVNGHTVIPEKMTNDHLDDLMESVRLFLVRIGVVPALWKADVDAAFRRIPLRPEHRWAAAVVFKCLQELVVAIHNACPFGATSSVHNWERLGTLICNIARRILKLGCFRYVDDFFGCERPETVEHAMLCMARLIRAMLGETAVAARKLECGLVLTVLGVDLSLNTIGYQCRPSEEKVTKWIHQLRESILTMCLPAGAAQKFAGRLSWSCQFMFKRVGRAMLRPFFKQAYGNGDGCVGHDLLIALKWWLAVLQMGIVEERAWDLSCEPLLHLFVDARGVPPRCAAVLFINGECLYTDGAPSKQVLDEFQKRADAQIMGLEVLAIAVGLATFAEELRGRKVIVWSDNKGAEAACRKGSAKSWDHAVMIHDIWSLALKNDTAIWIERVASDDNLSDLPSRESYELLHALRGRWRAPKLPEVCSVAQDILMPSGI